MSAAERTSAVDPALRSSAGSRTSAVNVTTIRSGLSLSWTLAWRPLTDRSAFLRTSTFRARGSSARACWMPGPALVSKPAGPVNSPSLKPFGEGPGA
jgi:hypothetical protein